MEIFFMAKEDQTNKTRPTKLPEHLPDSIYAIVAMPLLADEHDVNLEDIKIIGRNADALKFGVYFDTQKHKMIGPSQYFDYKEIKTKQDYYHFLLEYLSDKDQDKFMQDKPCKLTEKWHVYKSYAHAKNEATYLNNLQDQYYDSLLLVAKSQIDKHQIMVVDLVELMADFSRRKIIPDIVNSSDFIDHVKPDINKTVLPPFNDKKKK